MKVRAIGATTLLAVAGCTTAGKLEIRPSPASSAQAPRPVPERIAEARAQLALGNVALALELYRKAERERPGDVEALAGMAGCYEQIGRLDLARRYYETALASAPRNPALLQSLAGVLQRQGHTDQAEALLAEARDRPAIGEGQVTVALLPAEPVAEPDPVAATAVVDAAPPPLPIPAPAPSVTLALAEPVAPAPSPEPEAAAPRPVRLERLTLGEVALVTSGQPIWSTPRQVALAARVPIRSAPAAVRLLNAAREQGLAARTRSTLLQRGWGRIAIGDATRVRERSLVLYSAADREAAARLARQLGLALARDPRPGRLTVLLGRDAVSTGRSGGA